MKTAIAIALTLLVTPLLPTPTRAAAAPRDIFARDNLVAWCIVPFDAKKRGPEERAEMLDRLGIHKFAYDWRAEHVPTFEAEIQALKRHHVEYFAFWGTHEQAFSLFPKYGLKPQLWVTCPGPEAPTQQERIDAAAQRLLPLAQRAHALGCRLGLYNHGGWGGEPENMVAVSRLLRQKLGGPGVGIVYNLHHGHDHLDRLPAALAQMMPHLLCLNLNGMTRDGEKRGMKILPLAQGDLDLTILKTIRDSGYQGPIGILNHTGEDAELRLKDNLDGLDWLVAQLAGDTSKPKPQPRSWHPPTPVKP